MTMAVNTCIHILTFQAFTTIQYDTEVLEWNLLGKGQEVGLSHVRATRLLCKQIQSSPALGSPTSLLAVLLW